MVRRIDGMEHGTPLTMHSNNGEIIQGTFNGMYRDPGSNIISYITIKGKNGIITYHPLTFRIQVHLMHQLITYTTDSFSF